MSPGRIYRVGVLYGDVRDQGARTLLPSLRVKRVGLESLNHRADSARYSLRRRYVAVIMAEHFNPQFGTCTHRRPYVRLLRSASSNSCYKVPCAGVANAGLVS